MECYIPHLFSPYFQDIQTTGTLFQKELHSQHAQFTAVTPTQFSIFHFLDSIPILTLTDRSKFVRACLDSETVRLAVPAKSLRAISPGSSVSPRPIRIKSPSLPDPHQVALIARRRAPAERGTAQLAAVFVAPEPHEFCRRGAFVGLAVARYRPGGHAQKSGG